MQISKSSNILQLNSIVSPIDDLRGKHITNTIIPKMTNSTLLDGVVLFSCYIAPQDLPKSAVVLNCSSNALQEYNLDESGLRDVSLQFYLDPNSSTHTLDDFDAEEFMTLTLENVVIEYVPKELDNPVYGERVLFEHVANLTNVTIESKQLIQETDDSINGVEFSLTLEHAKLTGYLSLKNLLIIGLNLEDTYIDGEIKFDNCILVLNEKNSVADSFHLEFKIKNCLLSASAASSLLHNMGDYLKEFKFHSCISNNKELVDYVQDPELRYLGPNLQKLTAKGSRDWTFPIHLFQDFDWDISNSRLDGISLRFYSKTNLLCKYIEHMCYVINGADFTSCTFGLVYPLKSEGVCRVSCFDFTHASKAMRGDREVSLITNSSFRGSEVKILYISLERIDVIDTAFSEVGGIEEISREFSIFENCDFSNALIYDIGLVFKGLRGVIRESDLAHMDVLEEIQTLRDESDGRICKDTQLDIMFKSCNFSNCISYRYDVSSYGGVFFGEGAEHNGLVLRNRRLFGLFTFPQKWENCIFQDCTFISELMLTDSILKNCSFINCIFEAPIYNCIQNTILTGCRFEGCVLTMDISFFRCEITDLYLGEGLSLQQGSTVFTEHIPYSKPQKNGNFETLVQMRSTL